MVFFGIEVEIAGPAAPAPTAAPAMTAAPASTAAPVTRAPEPEAAPAHRPSRDVTTPPIASTRPGAEGDAETGQAAPAKRSRLGLWIGLGVLLAAAGSAVTLVVAGVLPSPAKWLAGPARSSDPGRPAASTSAKQEVTAGASASVAPPASAAVPPLDRLVGTWVSSTGDRVLEAVKVADAVEFRIKDPAQFAPADYEAGETRFVLRRIEAGAASPGSETVFSVEDRLRPNPPLDFPFDPGRARATCQEVRTEASGAPLRATLQGARLSVELMKLEPSGGNFLYEKGKTVSCVGLGKLKASRVVSELSKK